MKKSYEELRLEAYRLALDSATTDIWRTLVTCGARPILLKGHSTAARLYPDGDRGLSVDIDILIDPAAEGASAAALAELGYRPAPGVIRWPSGGLTFAHPIQPPLDLHTRLPFVRRQSEMFAEFDARAQIAVIGGSEMRELDDASLAVQVSLHAAHDGQEGERALRDLRQACRVLPLEAWTDATALARESGVADPFAAGMALTPDSREVARVVGLKPNRSVAVRLATGDRPYLVHAVLLMSHAQGLTGLARTAAFIIAPPPVRLRANMPLARHGTVGLVLAYLLRPVRMAFEIPALVGAMSRAWLDVRTARPIE